MGLRRPTLMGMAQKHSFGGILSQKTDETQSQHISKLMFTSPGKSSKDGGTKSARMSIEASTNDRFTSPGNGSGRCNPQSQNRLVQRILGDRRISAKVYKKQDAGPTCLQSQLYSSKLGSQITQTMKNSDQLSSQERNQSPIKFLMSSARSPRPRVTQLTQFSRSISKQVISGESYSNRSSMAGQANSWVNFHTAIDRVKQTRSQLEKCIQNLKSTQSACCFAEHLTENSLHQEQAGEEKSIQADKQGEVCEQDPVNHPPEQPISLKNLLLNPLNLGLEMTISEFHKLERCSSTGSTSPSIKSCLKHQHSSNMVLEADQNTQPQPNSKLKRAVSFSENVVMFIYQA
jgi:hypothetical protein